MEARSLPSKKRFHAAHIHICKIRHRTAPLNQLHRVLHVPSHRTQDSQSHHRRPVYSRRAMNEQLRVQSFERRFRKFHTLPKQPRWLRLEIIIRRIPQHLDAVSPSQRRIIELNVHIDDVRNPRLRYLRHILRRPNPASDRNPVGQPCDIHSYPVCPVPDAPSLAFFLRIALLGRARSASRSLRRMGNFAPGPTLTATRSFCCTASPHSTVSFTPDRASPQCCQWSLLRVPNLPAPLFWPFTLVSSPSSSDVLTIAGFGFFPGGSSSSRTTGSSGPAVTSPDHLRRPSSNFRRLKVDRSIDRRYFEHLHNGRQLPPSYPRQSPPAPSGLRPIHHVRNILPHLDRD